MDAVLLALAAAAGASGLWWYQARSHRLSGRAAAELGAAFQEDAEVALHVAQHEAVSRGHALSSIHILYGLLQDERVIEALRACGHDPEALENVILEQLATPRPLSTGVTERVHYIYAYAFHSAEHAGRKPGCIDLWAYLADSDADAVFEAAKVSHVDVLFRLCHGCGPQELVTLDLGDVNVVLRNDDYTTRDFVCALLSDKFNLAEDVAEARMMQVHTEGRGIVGRFRVAEAKSKITAAREHARSSGYPLWIGFEPV